MFLKSSGGAMRNIDKNLWVNETQFRLFGAEFGNRMTVIRLENNELLIHSPTKLDGSIVKEVSELGKVSYIVTPNNFHGLFAEEWCNAFKGAKYFSAKGDVKESRPIEDLAIEIESSGVEIIRIEGADKVNEYAFFHKATSSLILTDMAFNIPSSVPLWSKVFFSLNGSLGKFGPSRLMKSMITDQQALQGSIDQILLRDIERIIVSHGDIVESKARETMKAAFSWLSASVQTKSESKFNFSSCG